ncbi:MAG: S49 family peptidase [Tistlia sp.]|uniref:S49 family peptidase n=1 Tax=Tistlia sp. TaxID=3057121 RepID=UPI0034A4D386
MTATQLRRVASRIFDRPQLIEPGTGRRVVEALDGRLGPASFDLSGLDQSGVGAELQVERPAPGSTRERDRRARRRDALLGALRASAWEDDDCLREPEERPRKPFAFDAGSGMAVVPVEGELVHRFGHLDPYSGMTGYDGLIRKFRACRTDEEVAGVLVDGDSPGGEVAGCEACAEELRRLAAEKPVWWIANEMTCSAAYWLASAAHQIVAPPAAQIGSIGVLLMHVDMSAWLDAAGLKVTFIQAGAHKVDGNPYAPLPDAVRADLQAEILKLYGRFVGAVATNRKLPEAQVRGTEARVYLAEDALEAGLIDAVAFPLDAAAEFARQLIAERGSA